MRPMTIFVLAAAALGLGFVLAQPAAAVGDDTHGYGTVYVHHHAYAPYRYRHVYHYHRPGPRHVHVVHYRGDPYAWHYQPRGYYPYYGSAHWVPSRYMKHRWRYRYDGPKYRYFPAWGYSAYRPYCGRRC